MNTTLTLNDFNDFNMIINDVYNRVEEQVSTYMNKEDDEDKFNDEVNEIYREELLRMYNEFLEEQSYLYTEEQLYEIRRLFKA